MDGRTDIMRHTVRAKNGKNETVSFKLFRFVVVGLLDE